MAGFMSGFATAVTENINANKKRRQEKEDDIFKISYKSFLDNKDKMEEVKKKDAEAAANAQLLAAGTSDPEGSYKAIYSALKRGADFNTLKEQLETNDVEVIERPSAPKVSKENALDTETTAAFSGETTAEVETPSVETTPQPQNFISSLFSDKASIPEARQKAIKEIADATGADINEVAQAVSGSTMPKTSDVVDFVLKPKTGVKAKLGKLEDEMYLLENAKMANDPAKVQFYQTRVNILKSALETEARAKSKENSNLFSVLQVDENGNYIGMSTIDSSQIVPGQQVFDIFGSPVDNKNIKGRVVDPEAFNKSYFDLAEKVSKDSEAYNEKASTMIETMGIANKAINAAKADPTILTVAGQIASTAEGVLANVSGTIDVLKNQINESDDYQSIAGGVKELEDELVITLSDQNKDLAVRARAFNSMLDLLAFKFAALEKQQGRDVSNADYERFRNMVASDYQPATVEEKINNFLYEKIQTLDRDRNNLANNQKIKAFERTWKVKSDFAPRSIEDLLTSVDGQGDAIERYQMLKSLREQRPNDLSGQPSNQPEETNTTDDSNSEYDVDASLEAARQAIQAGKDPERVKAKLKEQGIDPGRL